jgi:hypothetical protein
VKKIEKFIKNYKYRGKTSDEWNNLEKTCSGFDNEGNPMWHEYMANATYAETFAKFLYKCGLRHWF